MIKTMGIYIAPLKKDNVRSHSSTALFVQFSLVHAAFRPQAFAVNYTSLIKQHSLVLEDCNRSDDNSNEEGGFVPLDKLQVRCCNGGIFA